MRVQQGQVRFFRTKHDLPRELSPTAPSPEDAALHRKVIYEEYRELEEGLLEQDLVKIADGAADLIYTVLGACVMCGIDLAPIFEEVHRSNMTKDKLDPVTRKGGKGPNYTPPRIAELLLLQTPSFESRCAQCGHPESLHDGWSDAPACIYHDSEGPCLCKEFADPRAEGEDSALDQFPREGDNDGTTS